MDVTNRAIIVGGALVAIFLVFVVIMLAWGAPDESIDGLADLAGYLNDHNDSAAKLIVTFGGLIVMLLAALVVIVEVSPPASGSLKVDRVGSGEASISTDEAARRIEQELLALPQIAYADVEVLGRGRKAELSLELHVTAEADLAATSEEACRRSTALLEERMGVELAKPPTAELHYRELSLARAESAATAPASPPPLARPAQAPFAREQPNEPAQGSPEDRRPGG